MSDIRNLTSNTIGLNTKGGITADADGQISIHNEADTNALTIDVDGSTAWNVVDNAVHQYNGTNAQAFYLYKTRTDASNYERAGLVYNGTYDRWNLTTEEAGTGTDRGMTIIADVGSMSSIQPFLSHSASSRGGGVLQYAFRRTGAVFLNNYFRDDAGNSNWRQWPHPVPEPPYIGLRRKRPTLERFRHAQSIRRPVTLSP